MKRNGRGGRGIRLGGGLAWFDGQAMGWTGGL